MGEFEVTCKVTKGELDIAYGEDCFCYYTKPNYNERIVRCKDCKEFTAFDRESNLAGYGLCAKFEDVNFKTSIAKQDGFCAWGERREDA